MIWPKLNSMNTLKYSAEDLLYFYELDKSNIKMNIDIEDIT